MLIGHITLKNKSTMSKIKLVVLLGMIALHQSSCANRTPNKYINKTTVSSEIYARNKQDFIDTIRKFISTNSSAYYPKSNDSLTKIFIDTILYSPSKDKFAFFVITENSSSKLLSGDTSAKYFYDAYCFVGHLDSVFKAFDVVWVSAYSLSNYTDCKETSDRIREIYFNEFIREGTSMEYNLNDIRFWKSSFWQKIAEDKEKDKAFEEMKKEHPENVYEPHH
jgi:hypothetical protein